jgi:hypothetical protein
MSDMHLLYIGTLQKKKERRKWTDGCKREYVRRPLFLLDLVLLSALSANWLNAHEQKFFLSYLATLQFPYSSLLAFFFVYLCMLVTDGHMCQNWHRWEEWWRPSTVTWERKTIRIQCVRWTCYAIRQTNRVKGTWQIFDLNEKKKKNEHRYWRHHIRLLYITFTWEIQTLYLLN